MKSDTGSDVAGTGILDTQRIVTGVGSDRVGANLVGCFFGQKIASRDRAVLSAGCAELPVLGLTAQLGSRFGATALRFKSKGGCSRMCKRLSHACRPSTDSDDGSSRPGSGNSRVAGNGV